MRDAAPTAPAYPEELRELADRGLADLRFARRDRVAGLEAAMRYSLLAGGKRIRPVLALATARAVDLEPGTVMPTACALELIHTYSLIHDDLPAMDDDELRRGRPTCHVEFGEDVAILAGDGLFAEAIRLISREQRGEPARVLAALGELAEATGTDGMVGGQYIDVTSTDHDADGLRELQELKTGRLIRASVMCVVALAGQPEDATIAFRRFSDELGILFQIVDDILDVTGTDEALGKPRGSDERHGKRTAVTVHGLDGARRIAHEAHARARTLLSEIPGETRDLERITDFIATRTS